MDKTRAITSLAAIALLCGCLSSFEDPLSGCVKGSGTVSQKAKSVPSFNGVEATDSLIVYLKTNASKAVTVEAEDNLIDYVSARVDEGRLVLSMAPGCIKETKPVIVRVYTDKISAISASQNARIVVESELDSDDLRILATTYGRIDATVNAGKLYSSASTNGTVNLGGHVREFSAYATQYGRILAFNMVAENASASAEKSSRVETYAAGTLDAKAYDGSYVLYKGGAKASKFATSSGTVKKID